MTVVRRRITGMETPAINTIEPDVVVHVALSFPQRETMTAEEFEAHERVLRQAKGLLKAYEQLMTYYKRRQS